MDPLLPKAGMFSKKNPMGAGVAQDLFLDEFLRIHTCMNKDL